MNLQVPVGSLGNPRVTFSRLGYHTAPNGSFERRLSSMRFPRFHVYVANKSGDIAEVSIHLDHKQHTYEGSSAHSGEYAGDLVEQELERIKIALHA